MSDKTYNKIAVVDVNKVVGKSKRVQDLKTEQETKVRELNMWLAGIKVDVESRKSEEEKQTLVAEYNKQFTQRQNEIRDNYTQKLKDIENEITELISKAAQEKGYDMVLSKYVVLFGGDDITEEIMATVQ